MTQGQGVCVVPANSVLPDLGALGILIVAGGASLVLICIARITPRLVEVFCIY